MELAELKEAYTQLQASSQACVHPQGGSNEALQPHGDSGMLPQLGCQKDEQPDNGIGHADMTVRDSPHRSEQQSHRDHADANSPAPSGDAAPARSNEAANEGQELKGGVANDDDDGDDDGDGDIGSFDPSGW